MGDKTKDKPTSNQSYKGGDKEFKYFVPQAVKNNTALGTSKPNYPGISSNVAQGQYQNFNNSSQFSNSNNTSTPATMNLNNSSSSAYRSNQIPPGSFNPQQKNIPVSSKPMSGLTSPTSLQNQSRPNIPVYSAQNNGYQQTPQMGMNQPQGQWRKH